MVASHAGHDVVAHPLRTLSYEFLILVTLSDVYVMTLMYIYKIR